MNAYVNVNYDGMAQGFWHTQREALACANDETFLTMPAQDYWEWREERELLPQVANDREYKEKART